MKVLVTGAGSAFGYHLCLALLDDGFAVRIPEADAGGGDLDGLGVETSPGGCDPESLIGALAGVNAVFDCGFCWQAWPPGEARESLETTGNLLVAMSRCGVERLVHAGTAFSFEPGSLTEPGDEQVPRAGPLFGLDCLGSAKQAQDNVLRFRDSEKVAAVVVNPTVVLGDHDPGGTLCSALLERAGTGEEVPPGGVNVVGAADAARATLKALGRGVAGRCYILGGWNVTYRELFALMTRGEARRRPEGPSPAGRGPLRGRLSGRRSDRLAGEITSRELYYGSARASSELGLEPSPLERVVAGARNWRERTAP
ncbi:MAG: NAD-dependent epimerase/dehydratase family protein [Actinomycetota bacterium]